MKNLQKAENSRGGRMEWSILALAPTKVGGEQYGRGKTTTGGGGGWVHGRLNNGGGSAEFFFHSTANSNHSKDGDSIKFHDNKKAESFLCNKSTAQLYVARHRGFPLYVYIECLHAKEFIRRLARSRELEVREREPNTDLRLEILAEFLPQSAAIAETLSGARWLTSASADVTHEIIGGSGEGPPITG